jgi:hypothetical protein
MTRELLVVLCCRRGTGFCFPLVYRACRWCCFDRYCIYVWSCLAPPGARRVPPGGRQCQSTDLAELYTQFFFIWSVSTRVRLQERVKVGFFWHFLIRNIWKFKHQIYSGSIILHDYSLLMITYWWFYNFCYKHHTHFSLICPKNV